MRRVQRLTPPPAVVFIAAVIAGTLWIVALDQLYGLEAAASLRHFATVVVAAAGGALGAILVSARTGAVDDKLSLAEQEARTDALTGLSNRVHLFEELERSLAVAKRDNMVVGVLFLDLNRFKAINDTMGHEVGDDLLRIVGERLRSSVRGTDLVARFGGDEFVVLCRELLSGDSVIAVAEQILKRFRDPVSLAGRDHTVSTSIGIALALPEDDRGPDDLIRDADTAMFKAKRTKTGLAVFDEAQRAQELNRLDVEREISLALDQGGFLVFYQPIIDVSDNTLYGFEALVRWNHPELGIIGPGKFLDVAVDAGLMGRLGELVLREACAQAAVWNHLNPKARAIRMGVNLAEQQMVDPNLPSLVHSVLKWSGLDPEQLVLEITEDVIVDHLDGLDGLRGLRRMGVNLAIDDFGTGQSSLSYVKQFDMVSTIKIDQTFVRGMRDSEADRAIIEAVVTMSQSLGLKVVAEGVEFPDQMAQLSAMGVKLMQGYLFNKPIPPSSIDANELTAGGRARENGLKPVEVSHGLANGANWVPPQR